MSDPISLPLAGVPDLCPDGCRRRGRPVQLDQDTRIGLILDAAETLLADRGIGGTSMSAIALAAGMSKRTVYELFASREELVGACLRRLLAEVFHPLSPAQEALPLAERLRLLVTMHWAPQVEDRSLELLRAAIAETRRQPHLAQALLTNGFSELTERIAAELERAVHRGEAHVDDIPLAAEILRDMVFENPVTTLLDPVRPNACRYAARDARRDRAIEIFCRGVA